MTARPGRHRPPRQPHARWPITVVGTTAAVLTVAAVAASIGSAFTVAAPERVAAPPTATSRPAASWSLAWPTPAIPSVGVEGAWDPATKTPERPVIATVRSVTPRTPSAGVLVSPDRAAVTSQQKSETPTATTTTTTETTTAAATTTAPPVIPTEEPPAVTDIPTVTATVTSHGRRKR